MDVLTRVQLLERAVAALAASGGGGTEALQPSYLTLTPGGLVGANFTGIISALGLNLKEASGSPLAVTNAVVWQDVITGVTREWIQGFRQGNQHALLLTAAPDATDSAQIQLSAVQGGGSGTASTFVTADDNSGGSTQALVLDSAGNSDFWQLGTRSGWFDVKRLGAKGDGVTDDTTAIQSAINNANAENGGTVYFPPGSYVITSALSLNQMNGIKLQGAGPSMQFQTGVSKLLYTSASGHLLTMYSSTNCELTGLDFGYNNAGYTGDLIDIDGNVFAADCQNNHIHHCSSKTFTGQNARSIIRLNKAVINQIDHCHWTGAVNSLRIGDAGGSYVVVLTIESCTFNFASNAHIFIGSADAEVINIHGCTFEAGTNTTGIRGATIPVDGAQCQVYNFALENCWFGDASANTTWLDGLVTTSDGYTAVIRDCFFGGVNAGTHLNNLRGSWLVMGNAFSNGTVYGANAAGHNIAPLALGNYYNNVTAVYGYTPYGRINLNDIGGAAASNALGTQAQVGPNLSSGITDDNSQSLVLGVKINGGVQSFTAAAAVIYNRSDGYLGLQGPAGTTAGVKVSSTGLGFYDAVPVAKQTVTGAKGGNAALASLMTALSNLGLVTDSTT